MKTIKAIALALSALVAFPIGALGQVAATAPVVGPSTFTFNGASQSNIWTCNGGQSSFSLVVPSGLTGTYTVTVAQTSGGTYVQPPWAYAPGSSAYSNTITNSGSLTVNLGSYAYVKVADTSYTSGSATVTGVCSGAVAVAPPANLNTFHAGPPNGVDDTAHLQAILNTTCPTPGGDAIGKVLLGQGDYKISSTLLYQCSNEGIQGLGAMSPTLVATPGTSTITWIGATGGTMISAAAPAGTGTSNPYGNLTGDFLTDVKLESGNGVSGTTGAAVGFQTKGVWHASIARVSCDGFTNVCFLPTYDTQFTVAGSGWPTMNDVRGEALNSGGLVWFDGAYGAYVQNVKYTFNNGSAIRFGGGSNPSLDESDTDTLISVNLNLAGGGTGSGVLLDCDSNSVIFYSSDLAPVIARGTSSCSGKGGATFDNAIYGDANGDSNPSVKQPDVEAGAGLFVSRTSGTAITYAANPATPADAGTQYHFASNGTATPPPNLHGFNTVWNELGQAGDAHGGDLAAVTNTNGSTNFTVVGTQPRTCGGVTGTTYDVSDTSISSGALVDGTACAAINGSGDLGASGKGSFAGSVTAGSGSAGSCPSGYVCASSSTTTGAAKIGGSASSCVLDYGVSSASVLTAGCQFSTNGNTVLGGSYAFPAGGYGIGIAGTGSGKINFFTKGFSNAATAFLDQNGSFSGNGDLVSLHNICGSCGGNIGTATFNLAGGSSGAGLGWNADGTGGVSLYDANVGSTNVAEFIHWTGSAYAVSAKIAGSGTYTVGNNSFSTSAITNTGVLTINGANSGSAALVMNNTTTSSPIAALESAGTVKAVVGSDGSWLPGSSSYGPTAVTVAGPSIFTGVSGGGGTQTWIGGCNVANCGGSANSLIFNTPTSGFFGFDQNNAPISKIDLSGFSAFPAGTATSGGNFGSNGGLNIQNSTWNGTTAVTNTYAQKGDAAGNLITTYNGATIHGLLPTGAENIYGPITMTNGSNITTSGTVGAGLFSGSGASITNLSPSAFASGSFTSGYCVKANNSATTTIQTGTGPCAYTNALNTFTADQTFNGYITQTVSGTGGTLANILKFNNTSATTTSPAAISGIYSYLPTVNSACPSTQGVAEQWDGASGASTTNLGGYHVFWTKSDGACSGNEVMVFTAGQHIYPAGPAINSGSSTSGCIGNDNQGLCSVTTASSCAAGAACGTVTVTFGTPFYQPDGTTHEQPYCFYSIQDTNLSSNAWAPVPETMAYDHFVVGYAPLAAQSVSRTLNIYWQCNASSY